MPEVVDSGCRRTARSRASAARPARTARKYVRKMPAMNAGSERVTVQNPSRRGVDDAPRDAGPPRARPAPRRATEKKHAQEGELDRRREPVPDQRRDRILAEVGLAEISVQRGGHPAQVLGRRSAGRCPASWRSRSIVSGLTPGLAPRLVITGSPGKRRSTKNTRADVATSRRMLVATRLTTNRSIRRSPLPVR